MIYYMYYIFFSNFESFLFNHKLSDSITSLQDSLFSATTVTSLNFPSSLTKVSDLVFDGMNELSEVNADLECTAVKVNEEKIIFNKDESTILFIPTTATKLNITHRFKSVNYELLRRPSFQNVTVEDNHDTFFADHYVHYTANKRTLLNNSGQNEGANIPKECEEIYTGAFSGTALKIIYF